MDIWREVIFVAVNGPGRETHHSLPYNAEVKNGELYLHSPTCLYAVVLN
jgi:hypothetical protein